MQTCHVWQLPMLRQICKDYHREDIFKADETVINSRMPPDRTISNALLQGRKKDKIRLTLLVCANASGSQKFPLMIIGNVLRPRCFRRKCGSELGFDYWANKKAWMILRYFSNVCFDLKLSLSRRPVEKCCCCWITFQDMGQVSVFLISLLWMFGFYHQAQPPNCNVWTLR